MRKLIYFSIIFFCFSCAYKKEPIPSYYQELEDLRDINHQLIKSNPKDLSSIYQLGISIKNQSLNLYVRYHKNFNDEENEFLLQCAATGSEAAQKYKDAVDYFLKAQRKLSLIHI